VEGLVLRGLRLRGFSLVELMVASALGLMLVTLMMHVLLSAKRSLELSETISRLGASGRFGLELLSNDVQRSGYLSIYGQLRENHLAKLTVTGSLGPSASAPRCVSSDSSWGRMIEQPLFGLNDTNDGYDCIPKRDYLRGDILVARYLSPQAVARNGSVNQGQHYDRARIYFRAGLSEGKIFSGSERDEADNQILSSPLSDHALNSYAYYVSDSGRKCQGLPIPGLFRETLSASGRPRREELVSGVENIQFQYQVSGQYFNADGVGVWADVQAVRVWLLVRTECPDPSFVDQQTYILGDHSFTPNITLKESHYRRRLYQRVVPIRNSG